MAGQLGNNGVVTVDAAVVAEVVDFSWDESCAIVDDSVLGDAADTHLAGSTNASGTINCFWDATDTTGQEVMTVGASLALIWLPEGNTTGDISYSATATIESVGAAVTRNGITTRSYTVNVNGAITKGTVPA